MSSVAWPVKGGGKNIGGWRVGVPGGGDGGGGGGVGDVGNQRVCVIVCELCVRVVHVYMSKKKKRIC